MYELHNVLTVIYCTWYYWVSKLCTLPQNTVNQKMCVSPETCNTFHNKANWVSPHYFTWRWKLTHSTKCAVSVMWEGGLTPWRCQQQFSPKFLKMSVHFSQTAILQTQWHENQLPILRVLFCLEYQMMVEDQKSSNDIRISQCSYACWPCKQIQNTIKCAANAHISTGSPTTQAKRDKSTIWVFCELCKHRFR